MDYIRLALLAIAVLMVSCGNNRVSQCNALWTAGVEGEAEDYSETGEFWQKTSDAYKSLKLSDPDLVNLRNEYIDVFVLMSKNSKIVAELERRKAATNITDATINTTEILSASKDALEQGQKYLELNKKLEELCPDPPED